MDTKVLQLLVGSVAHDFNNLLTIIAGNSEILLQDRALPARAQQLIRETLKAEAQAAMLCQELLAFSRNFSLPHQLLDVPTLLADVADMLRRLIGDKVQLATSVQAENCFVRLVPGQLERVLVNLAINARDAMPGGGTLEIAVAKTEANVPAPASAQSVGRRGESKKHRPRKPAGKPPARYVVLSVRDTGLGMDDQVKAHLFEPFFTTKSGQGLGLGLATVHTIVHRSGGFIEVDSQPGKGTNFRIYLPEVSSAERS